jgi:hypothetical protein
VRVMVMSVSDVSVSEVPMAMVPMPMVPMTVMPTVPMIGLGVAAEVSKDRCGGNQTSQK